MQIGVTKEIKNHEYRVGLTPQGAAELVRHQHSVLIERNAGAAIGFGDERYLAAGAVIAASAEEVFARADMIVKVKEPQPSECKKLRPGQVLFTYLHLAPDPEQTRLLIESDAVAIAYETVTDDRGGLPLLAPMSEVAGRMSIQAGAHALEKAQGGLGVLLSGVPGVPPANVVVLGGGVVGINAARIALGMGAQVTVFDVSLARLKELDNLYGPRLMTCFSSRTAIEQALTGSGPRHRRRAGARCSSAQAHHARHVAVDEARIGDRRCRHRSRRLRRDQPADNASGSDFCGRWHRPLLRCQYAGWRRAHLDFGVDQCNVAVRDRTREQRLSACGRRE